MMKNKCIKILMYLMFGILFLNPLNNVAIAQDEGEPLPQRSKAKQGVPIIEDIPIVVKIRRIAMEDGYTLTVESDGSFLLRFPPNNESEVAACLDQIFHDGPRGSIQFVPGVAPSGVQKLEEYMHDRNFSISSRFRATEYGQGITSWTLHKTPERIQIHIQKAEEREVRGRHGSVVRINVTDLGKHIQVGELQEVDKETIRITVYFDEDGKVSLRSLIAKEVGQKLILIAEGVTVGEGEVPMEGDGALLTFTLMPDKLKRLEHAFETSNLQLKGRNHGKD